MSQITLNPLFTSHMVFQANKPIRVFGEGEGQITVSFAGNTAVAECHEGKWLAELPPLPYGGPYVVSIVTEKQEIILEDVYIGHVFIVAGQSNLQHKMQNSPQHKDMRRDNPRLRLFSSPRLEEGEHFSPADGWVVCTKENAAYWTAVGYLTADIIERDMDIAVGVITSYQGASVIETWLPEGILEDNGISLNAEEKGYSHSCPEYSIWNKDGTLYHYVVEKLMPYSVACIVWYQGESDTSAAEAEIYDKELAVLIRCWRNGYRDATLPFIIVQLADLLDANTGKVSASWRRLQQAQIDVQKLVDNVTTVPCADVSENNDIHPTTKLPLARRIAEVMKKL